MRCSTSPHGLRTWQHSTPVSKSSRFGQHEHRPYTCKTCCNNHIGVDITRWRPLLSDVSKASRTERRRLRVGEEVPKSTGARKAGGRENVRKGSIAPRPCAYGLLVAGASRAGSAGGTQGYAGQSAHPDQHSCMRTGHQGCDSPAQAALLGRM